MENYYDANGSVSDEILVNGTFPPEILREENATTLTLDLSLISLSQVTGSYALNGVCLPLIGLCGVLGNILNLAVLSWRYNHREIDILERSALLGLIGLAVSDLCFCLCVLPHVLYYRPKTLFYTRGFHYYFHVYGIYVKNVFIKTSTCLTVVIATARYVGICHPLRARMFVGARLTKLALLGTFIVWGLLCLPLVWTYDVTAIQVRNTTAYLLDLGELASHAVMHQAFTYIWAILGYFIPLTLLTFCNINLIRALRESRRLRELSASPGGRDTNSRITLTLVVLILMFTVLVSPSEILHFYLEVKSDAYRAFEAAVHVTNILQALNFAFHFALYCAVNVTFRRTLLCACYCVLQKFGFTRKESPRFMEMSRMRGSRTSVTNLTTVNRSVAQYLPKSRGTKV